MPSADALIRRLETERTIALTVEQWEAIRGSFERVETHATGLGPDLVLLRGPDDGWFALEEPSDDGRTRVLRLLEDEEAAHRFVSRRLEQYERMWDGCGCRIDYHD